ncbi:MAG: hypothetical protein J6N67_02865, partial [Desulfovibrio sp.]|nr:hypothetical protein [Desulfovibrio sp.]
MADYNEKKPLARPETAAAAEPAVDSAEGQHTSDDAGQQEHEGALNAAVQDVPEVLPVLPV